MDMEKVNEYASAIPKPIRDITKAIHDRENFALYIKVLDSEQAPTITEIAREFGSRKSSIKSRMKKLSSVGLVMASPDYSDDLVPGDSRYYATELGEEFMRALFDVILLPKELGYDPSMYGHL